jgi:hypothetical protein
MRQHHLPRADAVEVLESLISLRTAVSHRDTALRGEIGKTFLHHCKSDLHRIADVLGRFSIDPKTPSHGRAAVLLSQCLPKADCDEVLWERIIKICETGLREGKWELRDVRILVSQISFWGVYPKTFPPAIETYVSRCIDHASPNDLAVLSAIITSITQTQKSPLMFSISSRAVKIADSLTPESIGFISGNFLRAQYASADLVSSLSKQIYRFSEECDLLSAIQLLGFITLHDAKVIDLDAIRCLTERIVMEVGTLDISSLMLLLKTIRAIPRSIRTELNPQISEFAVFVSKELAALIDIPSRDGGLQDEESVDVLQGMTSRYLAVIELLPKNEPFAQDVERALHSLTSLISRRAEAIISDQNPPFSIIPHLFEIPLKECRNCAVLLMREAALQRVPFPTLQTFRFLLALGDHQVSDQRIYRHLRSQFAQTMAGIPMIQLCAALRCFSRVLGKATSASDDQKSVSSLTVQELENSIDNEMEKEDLHFFLTRCHEAIDRGFSEGMNMRCVMSLTQSLFKLGYTDQRFYDQVVAYLDTKINVAASPNTHSVYDARFVALALGEDLLDKHPKVHNFLLEVQKCGTNDEHDPPTLWMNQNDPANSFLPLTEEQQLSWNVLEKMRDTRGADVEKLTDLANEYVSLLSGCRVDDLKYFFGVFEEKVFKNDKLLKSALEHIVALGMVPKLSTRTIASILHSLAAIRFAVYASTKKFLLSVSEEQWSTLDAGVLAHILSGMSKLSLRIPAILLPICERLALVYKFLTPMDTAVVVNSLQSLGYSDDSVIPMLIRHASSAATRFDEISLNLLFGASSIHRWLSDPNIVAPLVKRLHQVNLSPSSRQRAILSLKRSALPREFILESSSRISLAQGLDGTKATQITA